MDTFIMVVAGAFAVGMMFMLPKYAKFINNQPKEHIEKMRRQAEEEKSAKSGEEKNQD